MQADGKKDQFENWKNVWKIREILFQPARTKIRAKISSR